MKSVAHRDVALSNVVMPGDFLAWCEAHTAEIAKIRESRKALLLAHVPVVEAGSMRLIAGRRRMGALLADGVKRHVVHLVEGTPAELRRLAAVENLHRGHGDDLVELTRQYVDDREAEVEQERAEKPDTSPRKPGRPKTTRGEARARAAADAGTTPEAIRKRETRAVEKMHPKTSSSQPATGQDGAGDHVAPDPVAGPIAMHGIEAPDGWLDGVKATIDGLTTLDNKLRALVGQAGGLSATPAVSQAAREAIRQAGDRVRALIPVMACVYCRDPDGELLRAMNCSACGGEGTLTAEQAQRVPAEQLLPGAAPVVRAAAYGPTETDMVPVPSSWPAPKKPPTKAPERRRGMQIEVDGKLVSARELTIEREPGEDDAEGAA